MKIKTDKLKSHKIVLLISFIFFVLSKTFAQSKFSIGYNNGYKTGYCYDKGVDCISPIPPIAPNPNLQESLFSFQDGYNRGFIDGRGAAINIQKENISPYGREAYRPDIKPFVPDYNAFQNILKNRNIELEETKRKQAIIEDFRQKWNLKYNSKNNAASLEHANMIRNYHKYLTKSTLLPSPREDSPPEMTSDVFLVINYPSNGGKGGFNDMGTQVFYAKAFLSYNKIFKTNEIFNIYINDTNYENDTNIFKKNHPWEYENRIAKLNDDFPCPRSSYFINPMLIYAIGKVTGEYHSLYLKQDCINAVGQTYTTYPIEVYFIKDLEKFIKK